jgi:hypothetical protein
MVPFFYEQLQSERISSREDLIRELSLKYQLKGYNYSPLEREKITEFINTLEHLQRKQKGEFEKYQVNPFVLCLSLAHALLSQTEVRAQNDDYNNKSTRMRTEVEGLKIQKSNLRQQIVCLIFVVLRELAKCIATRTKDSVLLPLQNRSSLALRCFPENYGRYKPT